MQCSDKSLFEWKSQYSVGHSNLDHQHKKLLETVSALHKAFLSGESEQELNKIFQYLMVYVHAHFVEEEQSMKAHNYPEYVQHKAQHDVLYQQVLDLQKRLREGNEIFNLEVVYFLRDWVIQHVIREDKKYDSFLELKASNLRGVDGNGKS